MLQKIRSSTESVLCRNILHKYDIDPSLAADQSLQIWEACEELRDETGLRFQETDPYEYTRSASFINFGFSRKPDEAITQFAKIKSLAPEFARLLTALPALGHIAVGKNPTNELIRNRGIGFTINFCTKDRPITRHADRATSTAALAVVATLQGSGTFRLFDLYQPSKTTATYNTNPGDICVFLNGGGEPAANPEHEVFCTSEAERISVALQIPA
jgi:hypothetical protein